MPRRPSSSCRQFRRLHVEYVDGMLSAEAHNACETHLEECPACARRDVQIRRSLLTLQALTPIDISAGFHDRLCRRLSQEMLQYTPARRVRARHMLAGVIIAAAAVLMLAVSRTRPIEPVRLMPVMARAPETPIPAPVLATPILTAAASSPRFEAIPGRVPPSLIMRAPHVQSVRLQAVTYIGQ